MILKRWCPTCKSNQLHKRVMSHVNGLIVVGEWECLCCQARREQVERGPIRYGPDYTSIAGDLPSAG